MSVPDTQTGLIRDVNGAGHLKSFPVPEPGSNEVLIRNVAVASNPKDWKYPIRLNDYTYIEGNDVAGEIVKLGEGVTGLKAGQRVAAFTRMATKQNKVRNTLLFLLEYKCADMLASNRAVWRISTL